MGTRGSPLIAVVDDDKALLESISDLLAATGYVTLCFTSGRELLECNELKSIRCLISDIRMPDINGWQLVSILRDKRPQLPIILITAHDPEETGAMAYPEAVDSVKILRKPFEANLLLDAVNQATNP